MIRYILTLLILGISSSLTAETVNFPVFSIDVASEWMHNVEPSRIVGDTPGELISIFRPDGIGVLKMTSYVAPNNISRDRLRNLTNVGISTTLTWQEWGDFSGYQYSYVERGSFFKQWWLLNERTVLWITYESDADELQVEIETIDMMVNSITLNRLNK